MKKDIRPQNYRYFDNLVDYIGGEEKLFNGELIYPRQLELHLPGNHNSSCPMKCLHCQGMLFEHGLGTWENTALSLLHNLKGAVPYHIYGGAYTEPVINPYQISFLGATKYYGNHFGIHTSGAPLWQMQKHVGWLDEMIRLGTDSEDYISFSLDAASSYSHKKGKRTEEDEFQNILKSIEYIATHPKRKMSVRLCYLFNKWNSTEEEIQNITSFAKKVGVDSLRFSVPYAHYLQTFDKVENYKEKKEVPVSEVYRNRVKPYISKKQSEKPYIFYMTPKEGYTDISLYDFDQCVYGYYQLTYGADGYVYKCSAVAAPDMKHLRLGRITDNIEEFEKLNRLNQDSKFNAQKGCFSHGGRCNRMAVECNRKYRDSLNSDEES